MMATLDSNYFEDLNGFIDTVNQSGLQPFFQVRTYTHMLLNSAGRGLPMEEKLPVQRREDLSSHNVEHYLSQDESEDLEVKGSIFVDINRYLHSGKFSVPDHIINEGALKSIVGFLNSSGGTLVLEHLRPRSTTRYVTRSSRNAWRSFPDTWSISLSAWSWTAKERILMLYYCVLRA